MKDYSKIYNGTDYVSIYSKEGRNLLKRYVKKYKNKDFSISQSQFTDIQSAGELPGSLAATENQSLLRSIIEDHDPKQQSQSVKESSVKEASVHASQQEEKKSVREPSVHASQRGGDASVREPSIRDPSVHASQRGGEASVHEQPISEVVEEVVQKDNTPEQTEEDYEERSCTIC